MAVKILSEKVGRRVSPGEIVVVNVDAVMAQDGTAPLAIKVLREMLKEEIKAKNVAFVIDHTAPSNSAEVSALHKLMREFAKKWGIRLYDVGRGICHQVMIEEGYARPWTVVVGADSHTVTYGALGSFATGVGSTDAAIAMMSGKLWFKVPEALLFKFSGKLNNMVMGKDVILKIIADLGPHGATYMSAEFVGVKNLSLDSRLTISNMVVEMGAKVGLMETDEKVEEFLGGPVKHLKPDPDAEYKDEFEYELDKIEPMVAAPYSPANGRPVTEFEGIEVDQVFIGSCTNGRLEDLEVAARILKGKKVKTRCIVIAASNKVYLEALRKGYVQTLLEAGCVVSHSTCGPCVGAHFGVLGPNEVGLFTSNRNFKGRSGHRTSKVYLASPATAAATAATGRITDPREFA